MAARDGRKSRARLLLYAAATAIGIGSLVAAGSFQHNLEEAIKIQAKPLVGADILVRTRGNFDEDDRKLFASIPYPQLREIELTTVGGFPAKNAGRLLEVRGIEKGFPFYGSVKAEPVESLPTLFNEPAAIVEASVMTEFGLTLGDSIQLGSTPFRIAGQLKAVPGEAMASLFSAPAVFIDINRLPATGLLRSESLARQKIYFKIIDPPALAQTLTQLESFGEKKNWRVSTVENRQRALGRRADNATKFLKIAALIALLLGGIGVASILFVYAKDKKPMAATLRCLGAPAPAVFMVFLIQGVLLGMAGTAIGAVLGVGLQAALPLLVKQFVLVEIPFAISWRAIMNGASMGFGLSLLFTLLPLLSLRKVPPLAAIRADFNPTRTALRVLDFLKTRKPDGLSYAWRQGLSNMFRPNNQTGVLVGALGFGGALIFMISFLNSSLLRHISLSTGGGEPTLALIDIQPDQREGVRAMMKNQNAPIVEETSFVSMRIAAIKGRTIQQQDYPEGGRGPNWAFTREYRSTYRNTLGPGEEVVAGQWPAAAAGDATPISLEEGIAQDLGVTLGDEMIFDVQGLPVKTTVAAIRRVDWFRLRPSFFIVFAEGALEEAPQFTVMMTRVVSATESAAIQRQTRAQFPNVSAVDLRSVLDTLGSYFDKVALALRVMSFLVMITGLMILAGTLISGRQERLREAALLRTLGARKKDIRAIHMIEYGLIGLGAGLAGLALGLGGAFYVATQQFEISFRPQALSAIVTLAAMILLSLGTGVFIGRGMLNHPPLETLREEIS